VAVQEVWARKEDLPDEIAAPSGSSPVGSDHCPVGVDVDTEILGAP